MNKARKNDLDEKWKAVVIKAVTDAEFKRVLTDNPIETLAANGMNLPHGVEAKTARNKKISLVLTDKATEELKAEIHWWNLRLETAWEFGQEHRKTSSVIGSPDKDEDI